MPTISPTSTTVSDAEAITAVMEIVKIRIAIRTSEILKANFLLVFIMITPIKIFLLCKSIIQQRVSVSKVVKSTVILNLYCA